jgi:hypothetical protein
MHRLSPADELSEIRAEIARLKTRELVLRAGFLRDPDHGTAGRWSRIEVVQTTQKVFDAALLPEKIRNDPRFFRDRVVQTVRCLPLLAVAAARPGWPIQREAALH